MDFISKLPFTPSSVKKIDHENTMSSNVYEVLDQNNRPYVFKIPYSSDRFRRELYYLRLLDGKIPVPKVIYVANPSAGFPGGILLEFIDGSLLDTVSLNEEIAFSLGQTLARLHSIPIDGYGDLSVEDPGRSNNPNDYDNYFFDSMEEIKTFFDKGFLKKCENYFEKIKPNYSKLCGPCLVHRDFKLSNIFFKNNTFQALIDFESMKGSFAEEDFALIDFLTFDQIPTLRESFYRGYSAVKPLPNVSLIPFFKFCKSLGFLGFAISRNTYDNVHNKTFNKNINYLNRLLFQIK